MFHKLNLLFVSICFLCTSCQQPKVIQHSEKLQFEQVLTSFSQKIQPYSTVSNVVKTNILQKFKNDFINNFSKSKTSPPVFQDTLNSSKSNWKFKPNINYSASKNVKTKQSDPPIRQYEEIPPNREISIGTKIWLGFDFIVLAIFNGALYSESFILSYDILYIIGFGLPFLLIVCAGILIFLIEQKNKTESSDESGPNYIFAEKSLTIGNIALLIVTALAFILLFLSLNLPVFWYIAGIVGIGGGILSIDAILMGITILTIQLLRKLKSLKKQ